MFKLELVNEFNFRMFSFDLIMRPNEKLIWLTLHTELSKE